MTVVILAGCVAAFATLVGLVLLHPTVDDEHTLDASKRRHPSSRQPTHVHGVTRRPKPYDWADDEEATP